MDRAIAYFAAYPAFLSFMWNSAEGLFLGEGQELEQLLTLLATEVSGLVKERVEKLVTAKLGIENL